MAATRASSVAGGRATGPGRRPRPGGSLPPSPAQPSAAPCRKLSRVGARGGGSCTATALEGGPGAPRRARPPTTGRRPPARRCLGSPRGPETPAFPAPVRSPDHAPGVAAPRARDAVHTPAGSALPAAPSFGRGSTLFPRRDAWAGVRQGDRPGRCVFLAAANDGGGGRSASQHRRPGATARSCRRSAGVVRLRSQQPHDAGQSPRARLRFPGSRRGFDLFKSAPEVIEPA